MYNNNNVHNVTRVWHTSTMIDSVKRAGFHSHLHKFFLCYSQIKISGDGAAISHSSNLLVCSFAILEDENVMSSSGKAGGIGKCRVESREYRREHRKLTPLLLI